MYLLDTNVISSIHRAEPPVVAWLMAQQNHELHLSVLTIGEVRRGITKIRARRPARARDLEQWLAATVALFAQRILPVDQAVARVWGDLSVKRLLPAVDALIAATALHHGLAVVSRNVREFAGTGVAVVDPWTATP